jgi:ubiquinone/menaquinone biosynthesis C-methylase UbiE
MHAIDEEAFTAFEAAGWDERAAAYDDFFGPITSRLVGPLLDAVASGSGMRVLDVASGPGHATARAAARGASVVGVDIAEGMVTLASRLHPQLDFRVGNADALPFADESFEALVANFLLQHLARPERAAAEFFRVLVPGGRLALTAWDVPERCRLFGVFFDAVAEVGAEPPKELPVGPPIFRFSDERELVRLLGEQGLDNIEVETISFSQTVSSPDQLWLGFMAGTLRTAALVHSQTRKTQQQIRATFDRLLQPYRSRDRLGIPLVVKLASATKPPG